MYMRFGGIASGLDTHQIVTDLMRAERMKVDSLLQKKQVLEWQREEIRGVNNKLRVLRDLSFDMRLERTYSSYRASSTNDTVLTAKGGANSLEGTYNISVKQLAATASAQSSEAIGLQGNTTAKIADFFGYEENFKLNITLGSGEAARTAEIDVNVNADNIHTIVNKINNLRDADGKSFGIRAHYDETLDRIFIQSVATGESQQIKITDNTGEVFGEGVEENSFLKKLNLTEALYSEGGVKGQDAKIIMQMGSGEGVEYSFANNNINILGMSLNLRGTGETTVTVARDTEAMFENIVNFINKYNETVEGLNAKLLEQRYADYPPLTDTMREQLTDKEIEQWEEKARSGMLRRDPMLSSILTKLRSTVGGVVSDVTGNEGYDRLSAIGITTTANYMSATLVINEDKLREAIQKDPDGVMELFRKDGQSTEEMGIARRLSAELDRGIEMIRERAGSADNLADQSFMSEAIRRVEDDINRWEERLARIEDRYWRQFTAMEKVVAQLNEQSMWLMQQFGGGMLF
ncbi:flagellar filament capping protein FliD [Desulfofalx alkaliphila]|uniref:flagellar filament capping protein FliD n=1 Tax=Desulfofalx alkaliphila TaxID=105483 RepID=UPI0004E217B6|nr:flagellar filament capping protein FliD [Desulfofalx alkaliphila]